MKFKRTFLIGTSVALIAVAAVMSGCSKSSSPTAPGGGGGGGGSNTFDSGSLSAPASYEHVYSTAGSYAYHCTFHVSMGMTGLVTVSASATDSVATVSASGTSFTPSTVTIKPGGKVHWNITGGTHTVTSG